MRTAKEVGDELRRVKRLLNELLAIDGGLRCYWEGEGAVAMAMWVLEGRASVAKSLEDMIRAAREGMLGVGGMQSAPGDETKSLIPKEEWHDLSVEADS